MQQGWTVDRVFVVPLPGRAGRGQKLLATVQPGDVIHPENRMFRSALDALQVPSRSPTLPEPLGDAFPYAVPPFVRRRSRPALGVPMMSEDRRTAEEIIPVIQEHIVIDTERATTRTVRVRTVTHEDEHAIDEPVTITDVEVKRVPVDLWTDEPIADRLEGDTRIISVHREEIIVQRRLHVIEEVHVTLRRREERHHEIVRTQQTKVVVERDGTLSGE